MYHVCLHPLHYLGCKIHPHVRKLCQPKLICLYFSFGSIASPEDFPVYSPSCRSTRCCHKISFPNNDAQISMVFSLIPLCLPIENAIWMPNSSLQSWVSWVGPKRKTDPLCYHHHECFWLCKSDWSCNFTILLLFSAPSNVPPSTWTLCFNHHTYSFLALIDHTLKPILSTHLTTSKDNWNSLLSSSYSKTAHKETWGLWTIPSPWR